MKIITLTLPDSVPFSEAEIRALVLDRAAEAAPHDGRDELAVLLNRAASAEEIADIRHLIGLYCAERATRLVDAQWQDNAWTADTTRQWLQTPMRTAHGRPTA